jgi:hypothetical protein
VSMAGALGVTSIPVLTQVASFFGVTVLTATPAGWIAGGAIAGGAAAYGLCQIMRSAGNCDEMLARRWEARRAADERFQRLLSSLSTAPEEFAYLTRALAAAVASGLVSPANAIQFEEDVRSGFISPGEAQAALCSLNNGEKRPTSCVLTPNTSIRRTQRCRFRKPLER